MMSGSTLNCERKEMFQVFEDGRPCDSVGYPIFGKGWDKSTFDTFDEALKYARK
jgi:hypothetical protein